MDSPSILIFPYPLQVGLARVERIAHGFADKGEKGQHNGEAEERGDAEPRRLKIILALRKQLSQGRAARRQA